MTTEFANIELALIAPSLTNPRKNFNPTKLAELAEDIKRRGIDTPITVRPLPGSRVADTDRAVQFELVCGERRLRASELAGVATIPAMVRALTDDQALEIQLCENLKRDDLTELEEAEGYETLMRHANINADQVGERIGKSRSYVYGRIKLLDLCSEARVSLRDGTIDASRALLVARIPDHKLQIKAMKEIVAGHGYSMHKEPMTYRVALEHLQHNYMLKLSEAKFKITNVDLVPAAGSCKTCTKRTGHDPDLFSDVKGADICTDPPCFHKKEEAHAATQVKEAKDKGQTVIAGKAAQELRAQNSYRDKFVGYRALDAVDDSPTDQPLRKLIGPLMKAEGIKPVLIEGQRNKGELVECLPNEVVLKLLKTAEQQAKAASDGKADKAATKEMQQLVNDKKAKAEAKAKAQYERDWRANLVHDTYCTMRDDADIKAFDTQVHRYLAVRAANGLSTDHAAAICKLLSLGKVSPISAVAEFAKETPAPDLLHLLIIMQEASGTETHTYGGRVPNEGLLLVAGNVFGKQLDDVIKEIKAEVKAEIWPKVTKKPNPATAPAARPEVGAGGAKAGVVDKAVPVLKKPSARAAKLSAEEATLGIAAAMQGVEAAASAPVGAVALPAEPAGVIDPQKYLTATNIVITQRNTQPAHLVTMLGVNMAMAICMLDQMQADGIVSAISREDGTREVLTPSPIPPTDDPLFQSAVDIIVREQKANVRLLKAGLKVGTTKALDLMDKLQQAGKVSACDERGARKVLVAA
jgi:ParB/RepB/Spo0J family partition protein